MKFGVVDPAAILRYGVIGLGFLLALLAYRLLVREQHSVSPRPSMLAAINRFTIFAVVLVGLGLASEIGRLFLDGKPVKPPDPSSSFESYLADLRKEYADASRPEAFKKGTLTELSQETLVLNLPRGACKTYLVATEQQNEIRFAWWSNGPGARSVKIDSSGSENFKTGNICTGESVGSEAEVGLQVTMAKGSGKYAIETYFATQRDYGPQRNQ
jgi:hypothetical protein